MAAADYTAYLPAYGCATLTVFPEVPPLRGSLFYIAEMFLKRFCDLPNNNIKLMPLFIIGVR